MKDIMRKMIEIRRDLDKFFLDSQAKGTTFSFEYVSGSQILRKFRESANEHGVMFTFDIIEYQIEKNQNTYKNLKQGYEKTITEYIITGKVKYVYFDIDSGESFETIQPLLGSQGDPSQALGAALTYGERYQILKQFSVPTDNDDPDKRTQEKPKENDRVFNEDVIPHPKAKKNGWTWKTAPIEFLEEISRTSDNPELVDLADQEQHDRNMAQMDDKIMKIIKGGTESHGDEFRKFLKEKGWDTAGKIRRLPIKEKAAAHTIILKTIQDLNRAKNPDTKYEKTGA